MEWQLMLLLTFASLVILMATGMPIALCFMLINVIGAYVLFGGVAGLEQLILSIYSGLATFVLLPLPLFILMGEALFHSGMGPVIIDILDKWLVRLPGRLGLLAVAGGTLLSVLTGASVGSVAMLGNTLVPEMERRGYKKPMSLGPILGSGGLAIMIPPSGLAILLGAIGEISIGGILIAIIIPGLLMAGLYAAYIVGRCWLQPSIAPPYEVPPIPLLEKLVPTIRRILPVGFIIFMVTGVILLGIATPSEAAASGSLSVFILAAAYGRLNWEVVKKSTSGTLQVTGMIFLIIAGAKAFSSILSFSGATAGLAEFTTGLPITPIFVVIIMQVVVLIMGAFMEPASIMMITLPIFVPVIRALGFNPVWFAAIYLLNIEMSLTTPPFGLNLFVMKGVAPPDTTMRDIYLAGLPFLVCDAIVMALLIAFPSIVLWLPSLMH